MCSGELCQCLGITKPPGTLKKMSALGFDGSPWSTAISQPLGMNSGHGPHFKSASLCVRTGGAALAASSATAATGIASASMMASMRMVRPPLCGGAASGVEPSKAGNDVDELDWGKT